MHFNWIFIVVGIMAVLFSIIYFLKTNNKTEANKTEHDKTDSKNIQMPENIVKYYKTALFSNH